MYKKSRPVSRVLSRTVIHLGLTSPSASSNLPEPDAGRAIRFLFGLAPGGVYPAVPVASHAVRSYRTISPLPALACLGGIFSAALSIGSRRPDVIWHPALWSPDFPLSPQAETATARPAQWSFYRFPGSIALYLLYAGIDVTTGLPGKT